MKPKKAVKVEIEEGDLESSVRARLEEDQAGGKGIS